MPGTSSCFTSLREHSLSDPPDGAKADRTGVAESRRPGVELVHAPLPQCLRRLEPQQGVHLAECVGDRRAQCLDQRATRNLHSRYRALTNRSHRSRAAQHRAPHPGGALLDRLTHHVHILDMAGTQSWCSTRACRSMPTPPAYIAIQSTGARFVRLENCPVLSAAVSTHSAASKGPSIVTMGICRPRADYADSISGSFEAIAAHNARQYARLALYLWSLATCRAG